MWRFFYLPYSVPFLPSDRIRAMKAEAEEEEAKAEEKAKAESMAEAEALDSDKQPKME